MTLMKHMGMILMASTFTVLPAHGQSSSDYEAAARRVDRAIQAYKELQQEKQDELARESLTAAIIHVRVCKAMFEHDVLP